MRDPVVVWSAHGRRLRVFSDGILVASIPAALWPYLIRDLAGELTMAPSELDFS